MTSTTSLYPIDDTNVVEVSDQSQHSAFGEVSSEECTEASISRRCNRYTSPSWSPLSKQSSSIFIENNTPNIATTLYGVSLNCVSQSASNTNMTNKISTLSGNSSNICDNVMSTGTLVGINLLKENEVTIKGKEADEEDKSGNDHEAHSSTLRDRSTLSEAHVTENSTNYNSTNNNDDYVILLTGSESKFSTNDARNNGSKKAKQQVPDINQLTVTNKINAPETTEISDSTSAEFLLVPIGLNQMNKLPIDQLALMGNYGNNSDKLAGSVLHSNWPMKQHYCPRHGHLTLPQTQPISSILSSTDGQARNLPAELKIKEPHKSFTCLHLVNSINSGENEALAPCSGYFLLTVAASEFEKCNAKQYDRPGSNMVYSTEKIISSSPEAATRLICQVNKSGEQPCECAYIEEQVEDTQLDAVLNEASKESGKPEIDKTLQSSSKESLDSNATDQVKSPIRLKADEHCDKSSVTFSHPQYLYHKNQKSDHLESFKGRNRNGLILSHNSLRQLRFERTAILLNMATCIVCIGFWGPFIFASLARGLCPASLFACQLGIGVVNMVQFKWLAYASAVGFMLAYLLVDPGLRTTMMSLLLCREKRRK